MLGGVDCNVSETGTHACSVGFLGGIAGATVCNGGPMDTASQRIGAMSSMLEVASNDNCNNYFDDKGHLCGSYANEPVDPNCTVELAWIPFL
jgi:hypothetical protein